MFRSILKKNLITLLLFSLILSPFSFSQSQEYPKAPIQLVVPFAPGGAVDIFWRNISDILSKNLNVTITILNKSGGGGVVGTSYVVNSKPDGYTIGGGTNRCFYFCPTI